MGPIFVAVKPEDLASKMRDTNAIRLDVDYMKGRGIRLSAFPATRHDDGRVIIGITQGRFTTLEKADRLDRKRVEALESLARNQLSLRTGTAWDIVQWLCSDHRLVIDDEPQAAVSWARAEPAFTDEGRPARARTSRPRFHVSSQKGQRRCL